VDGLRIFKEVEVDLIAPDELSMPKYYIEKMSSNGFKVRSFYSLNEYINQKHIADIWYFTRLQLERMGEDVRDKAKVLRESVTFKREYSLFLPSHIKFYHPLPRHRVEPTIPFFLDKTSLNGWESQSINGYYTRIIEIAMLGGKLGNDFVGEQMKTDEKTEEFVIEVEPRVSKKQDYKIGIIPIKKGIVIDHIGKGDEIDTIWEHINNIRKVLNLNVISSHGVFRSEKDKKAKGIIAIPDKTEFDTTNMKKMAAIAPGCTLNRINDERVTNKYRIYIPPKIYNFREISCDFILSQVFLKCFH
jgi:aspartate carbamoyltransferase